MGVAWVTGAGKGIGRAVALELAQRGWSVAVSARTQPDLDTLAKEASVTGGHIVPVALDVIQPLMVSQAVEQIENEIGGIDLAILNAGSYLRFGATNFDAEKFRRQIELNVMGTVNCLEPVLRNMRKRSRGHIAVVSSLTAYRGLPYASAYGASKAALTNMCEALKPELDALGIGMSVIHPGFVKTPLTDKNDFGMPFLMEANDAARRVVDGVERGKFEILFPRRFGYMLKIGRFLPYKLYFKITAKLLKK